MMEELKETEVGKIPRNWGILLFPKFVILQRGKDLTKVNFKTGNVPVAGSNGIIGYHDTCFVNAPGVTVGRSGSCGRVCFYETDFWAHNTSLYIKDFNGNDELFSYFYLQYLDVGRYKTGASVPTLDRNTLNTIKIPLPPLPEQRKIAHVLSTVQKAIGQQDKLIRTTTELKKALMQKLFTEGTRGEPQKETEIGLVPVSWDVVELGKHSYIRTSFPTFNKLTAKYKSVEQGTEFFFLKVSDMNMAGNEIFIYESNNKFLNDRPTDFANGFIKPNSLIFPKRGAAISTNKKRITTKYSVLDPNLIGVEPNSNIDANFLYNFFEMFDLSSLQDNNVIPQLNKHNVAGVKFPLPSIEEQRSISKYIENFDNKITIIDKKKQTLTDLFKTLLYELMTGQRRVHELEFENMEDF